MRGTLDYFHSISNFKILSYIKENFDLPAKERSSPMQRLQMEQLPKSLFYLKKYFFFYKNLF
jgi:hypothetical protein